MALKQLDELCPTHNTPLVEVEGTRVCMTCFLLKHGSKISKQNGFGDSKEVGRLQTSDTIEVVVSKGPKGYSISKYIKSDRYTGWGKGGVFIPEDLLTTFLGLFGEDNLQYALYDAPPEQLEHGNEKDLEEGEEVSEALLTRVEEGMTEQGDD